MPAAERTPTMRWHAVARRWLRRGRGWWPDRNPLRRRCDRAEAALVTVLVAVFVAGAPLLAVSAGRWAPDGGPAPGPAQPAGWYEVPAVLRTATTRRFAPSPATAWARWTAPGGVPHTGKVLAPAGLTAGAVVPVWVDAAGRLAGPPASPGRHDGRALAEGLVAVLLLAELLWGAGLAAGGVVPPAPPGGVGRRMAGHRAGLGRSPMTRLRTGGAAAPQAPRPARPGHKPTDQAARSRWTRGPESWAGDDGPPGRREAQGRAAWQATGTRAGADGVPRGRSSVRRLVTRPPPQSRTCYAGRGAGVGRRPLARTLPGPCPTRPRHRREADQAGRWRWLR
jgi:hypothetical protein